MGSGFDAGLRVWRAVSKSGSAKRDIIANLVDDRVNGLLKHVIPESGGVFLHSPPGPCNICWTAHIICWTALPDYGYSYSSWKIRLREEWKKAR